MTRRDIQLMQEKIGVTPDGFWGPASIKACQEHLRKMVAQPNQWPAQDEVSLQKFYGSPGDTSQLVQLSVADLCIKYDGKKVKSITCHKKVARSLGHILEAVCECFPHIAAEYAGCYNDRLMRHGTRPSLHARGAAIDFWPQVNGNRTQWPVVAQMPLEVMEFFAIACTFKRQNDSNHFNHTDDRRPRTGSGLRNYAADHHGCDSCWRPGDVGLHNGTVEATV